jgi:hypothetical protein
MNETTVRSKIGVGPKTMRTIREALQPGGFVERGREIEYTTQGLRELEAKIGVPFAEKDVTASQDAPGMAEGGGRATTGPAAQEGHGSDVAATGEAKKTAMVTNAFLRNGWLNPRLVSATVDGQAVRVRVKNGALRFMRPGMQLEVKHVQAGLWECNQMPKAPGRMM